MKDEVRTCTWCFHPAPNGRAVRQQNTRTGLAYARYICKGCEAKFFAGLSENEAGVGIGGNYYYREVRP